MLRLSFPEILSGSYIGNFIHTFFASKTIKLEFLDIFEGNLIFFIYIYLLYQRPSGEPQSSIALIQSEKEFNCLIKTSNKLQKHAPNPWDDKMRLAGEDRIT